MKFYTDYPFVILLGDKPREPGPIREIEIKSKPFHSYEKDYCAIVVDGKEALLSLEWIYKSHGHRNEVPSLTEEDLKNLDLNE